MTRAERSIPPAAVLAAGLVMLLGGCATGPSAPTEPAPPVTPLERARAQLPGHDVLDINIVRFEADVPEDPEFAEVEQVFTDVRAAEARYVPVTLRETLERSGHWGDVRVVPQSMPGSELEISGRILDSHGQTLRVAVTARDATGRVWLERTYEESINAAAYQDADPARVDPFQNLYNRISNDLVALRGDLVEDQKRQIGRVAELRFARSLAPDVYTGQLVETDAGRLRARPGPAPMNVVLEGPIDEARRRDARMIDVLDQHYREFHRRMEVPYSDWRETSQQEMANLQELRRQANTRKVLGALALLGGIFGVVEADGNLGQFASQVAIAGGIYAIASGIDKSRQTSIHVESLRELGRSLNDDLAPRVVDIRDKTVRLTGSAEVQYDQWREILAEMVDEQRRVIEQDAAERARAGVDVDGR